MPIISIAKELDISIVGIHHTGKLSHFTNGDWQQLLVGSVHWYSVPRTIYYTHKFTDGRRVFVCIKSDIKEAGGGYEYDITTQTIDLDGETLEARILERGISLEGIPAEEIFAELADNATSKPKQGNKATEFLREQFESNEKRPAKELLEIAKDPPYNLSPATLNRALKELGIEAKRNIPNKQGRPNSAWSWQAPEDFEGLKFEQQQNPKP